MDRTIILQSEVVENEQSDNVEGVRMLDDVQLALIGGGIADVIGV